MLSPPTAEARIKGGYDKGLLPLHPAQAPVCRLRRKGLFASTTRAAREVISLTYVQIREGDSIEKALRKFRRKVEQAGIRKEVRKREYYLKPGEQKRKKEREAQRRRFKTQKKVRQSKRKTSSFRR